MNLFRALTEKSWENQPDSAITLARDAVAGVRGVAPQRIALRFFLGVVGILFGLFITAYFIRMELDDWRPMPESPLLWFNTLLLFAASVALQWTRMVMGRDDRGRVKSGLLMGALLTLGFIFGQVTVWRQLTGAGYLLYTNPANAFFYVLTGIHGLHILGGLWVWIRASVRVWSGARLESVRLAVELCSIYWHFLLLVWLALFGLLSYT